MMDAIDQPLQHQQDNVDTAAAATVNDTTSTKNNMVLANGAPNSHFGARGGVSSNIPNHPPNNSSSANLHMSDLSYDVHELLSNSSSFEVKPPNHRSPPIHHVALPPNDATPKQPLHGDTASPTSLRSTMHQQDHVNSAAATINDTPPSKNMMLVANGTPNSHFGTRGCASSNIPNHPPNDSSSANLHMSDRSHDVHELPSNSNSFEVKPPNVSPPIHHVAAPPTAAIPAQRTFVNNTNSNNNDNNTTKESCRTSSLPSQSDKHNASEDHGPRSSLPVAHHTAPSESVLNQPMSALTIHSNGDGSSIRKSFTVHELVAQNGSHQDISSSVPTDMGAGESLSLSDLVPERTKDAPKKTTKDTKKEKSEAKSGKKNKNRRKKNNPKNKNQSESSPANSSTDSKGLTKDTPVASTIVPLSSARRSIQEDRLSLEAIIDGSDMKQAVLSEEYIQYIVKQSSDEAGKPKTLGEGFFGVVFEGKDPELHSTFAVKTIRTYVIDGGNEQHLETARETFQKEQKVLSTFRHPNIARLLGYSFPADGRSNYYLVYECAGKGSLDRFWTSDLGRDRLSSFRQRALIAWNVMAGLRFLHAGNDDFSSCFHRDVKSANIVLKNDFTAQLIDCGLAKRVQEDVINTSGHAKGTPGYWCPEYSQGILEQYEERCDIYSFGVVLAELWTGKLQNHKTEDSRVFNFSREYVQGNKGNKRNITRDIDPTMGYDPTDLPDHVRNFALLALECMEHDCRERPDGLAVMKRLTRILEGCNKEVGLSSNAISVPSALNAADRCVVCQTYDKVPNQSTCAVCSNLQSIRNDMKRMMGAFISQVEGVREENTELFQKTFSKIDNSFGSIRPVLGQLDTRLNNPIPRLFILYPAERKVGWQKFISKVKDKASEKYCLQFVCAATMVPIEPAIKFRVTKNWVKAIAPALAVSMYFINVACQAAVSVNPDLPFKCGFMGKTDIVSMLSELDQVLIDNENCDLSTQIRSKKLNEQDIQRLSGPAYDLIIEKATEQMGWRANMEPVTKPSSLSTIWVSKEVAFSEKYDYKMCIT